MTFHDIGALPEPFPTLPFNTTDASGNPNSVSTAYHQTSFSQYSLICVCRQLFLVNPSMGACLSCRNATATEAVSMLCEQNPDGLLTTTASQFVADTVQYLAGPLLPVDPIYGRWWNRSASYYAATDPSANGGSSSTNDLNEVNGRRIGLIIGFIVAGLVACFLSMWLGRYLLLRYYFNEPASVLPETQSKKKKNAKKAASGTSFDLASPPPMSRGSTFLYSNLPRTSSEDDGPIATEPAKTSLWDRLMSLFSSSDSDASKKLDTGPRGSLDEIPMTPAVAMAAGSAAAAAQASRSLALDSPSTSYQRALHRATSGNIRAATTLGLLTAMDQPTQQQQTPQEGWIQLGPFKRRASASAASLNAGSVIINNSPVQSASGSGPASRQSPSSPASPALYGDLGRSVTWSPPGEADAASMEEVEEPEHDESGSPGIVPSWMRTFVGQGRRGTMITFD